MKVKAISDSRNSISTINAETANIIGLKIKRINANLSGIKCGNYFIKNKITTTISNARGDFSKTLLFFVFRKISNYVLNNQLDS